MPNYSTPSRNYYRPLFEPVQLSRNSPFTELSKRSKVTRRSADTDGDESSVKSDVSVSVDKSKAVNQTYVLSASKRQTESSGSRARLTLQRRNTDSKGPQRGSNENTVPDAALEKRPALQRRTRTGSTETNRDNVTDHHPHHKIPTEPNSSVKTLRGPSSLQRAGSLRDTALKSTPKPRLTPATAPAHSASKGIDRPARLLQKDSAGDRSDVPKADARKTPAEKGIEKDVGRDGSRSAAVQYGSLDRERVRPAPRAAAAPGGTPRHLAGGLLRSNPAAAQPRKTFNLIHPQCPRGEVSDEGVSRESVALSLESLKMESSAVTVAVRVRPFSNREKTENAHRVVFMENQETIVQHPDSKHRHSFIYDFSFFSFDETDPDFASQNTVYEKLALPLLERAFEGYNTCLFAYGQTGSGKSYTMMGFEEEAGVTPTFCEELFSRVSESENQQITYHLEMSYFEVYNEKIHDLLVVKDEQTQKKLPLRVREHPIFGPFVEDLSANVVSSYRDIQSWLELGNKQRATAATGMNDKSSRSHSVFTLVMTQTKTEFVEEEEHDHTITSRINLVDLAGSERCSTAQTSGNRLREGVSINKSLLTLGKVISALSEHSQTKRKVFIPYRESVLTWLLKESLGGNSKTAMIATISPASSNVEETLSTLRYARQARMIINAAKVNEDTNAKLIRELKAEVEKLKAAQMSTQGIEPEKIKVFQQEISGLKMRLTQQEREMAEAHRTWKERLEQAEKRKREETIELQKAGITFKVDNRLPNLVNLNEDPQLSEMLLYMIKEGKSKVGKQKSGSTHDIQLSGALICDDHCVISNVGGTVSITPIKDAKTFVNGNLVSDCNVLHHGDRVILGGDHYFRFNHPVEVQSGKRGSCWTGAGDGHKGFEFAKNELLAAQRAQLEAEIEEARMKAKEEMIQGIQVAKEVAQKELLDQKALFENKIKSLEKELEAECEKKKRQEINKQKVASKMEELQSAKIQLEQEVHVNRKRLQMEALATRQALVEHDIRHAKIIEALEEEKRKITKDLEKIQQKSTRKEISVPRNTQPQWDSMKLSLMVQEANAICRKLGKNCVFSRHEPSDKENGNTKEQLQVQVQNTKLGITTFWSLDKFEGRLAAMRELDQGDSGAKDDDVFYDPNDEWEPDISTSSDTSSFSRRRSRSLLKSRRISGRLYEIRVHPIQSLHNSQYSGLMSKTKTAHSSVTESALPGICKDLISSAVARLRGREAVEESVADRLTEDVLTVHSGVSAISALYEHLDEDSQDNLFVCNKEAQFLLVKATAALERIACLTMQWICSMKLCASSVDCAAEDLRGEVQKMGGYFQLLIQGCDSEISSMVTEAKMKIDQCTKATLKLTGHLAVVTGTVLHIFERPQESSVVASLLEGARQGLSSLLEAGVYEAKEMQRTVRRIFARTQVLQDLKKRTLDVATTLQSYISSIKPAGHQSLESTDEDSLPDLSQLKTAQTLAMELLKFNMSVRQVSSTVTSTLKGEGKSSLGTHRDAVWASCEVIRVCVSVFSSDKRNGSVSGLRVDDAKSVMAARVNVESVLKSLTAIFDQICGETDMAKIEDRLKGVPKVVYTLSSHGNYSPSAVQWV
ncbi:kinesin-like protein KIF14 [Amia ocellicauda]|uniref:kinesin-like protein KIF14 n=1 Tax=Amia ocellicauda TaxID=2972642 RepID=UPI003464B0D3